MTLVIFHRQFRAKRQIKENTASNTENVSESNIEISYVEDGSKNKDENRNVKGLTEFSYNVKANKQNLILSFGALEDGRYAVKDRVSVPVFSWSQFNVFYQPNTKKLEVVDLTSINSVVLGVGNNRDNFIARILTTDTETLIYLRGRIKDIPGFKNILVKDDQNSAQAFSYYSSKAKHFLEDNIRRRNSLGKVDVYKYLCLLETQIDVLTKIILDRNLVQDSTIKSILNEAIGCSACMQSSAKTLQKRLQYKKQVQFCQEYC